MAISPVSLLTHLSQLRDALRSLHKGDRLPWVPLAGLALLSAALLWSFTSPTLVGVDPTPRPFLGLLPSHQLLTADIQKLHWIEMKSEEAPREMQRLRAQLAQLEMELKGLQEGGAGASEKAGEELRAQVKKVKKALASAEAAMEGMRREKTEIEMRLSEVLRAAALGTEGAPGREKQQGGEERQEQGQGQGQGQEQVQEQGQGQVQEQAQVEEQEQHLKQESPASDVTPQTPEQPAPEQTPSQPEIPATEEAPAEQDNPSTKDNPSTVGASAKQNSPVTGELPAKQESPAAEEPPAKEESPSKQSELAPANQGNAPAEESPAKQESPPAEESPAKQETPLAEESPAKQESPPAEESPAKQESPPAEESPAKKDSPAAEEAPAQQESPAAEEAPAKEESPAAEEAPGKQENPAAEEAPVKQESPAAEKFPAKQESPAAEEAPAQQESPAAEESPAKQESQVPEGSPANQEISAAEETPAKQERPAAEEPPAKQESPVAQESAPKLDSPAVEDEWPPISLKTLQEHTQPLSDWPGVAPLMNLSSLRPGSAPGVPGGASGAPDSSPEPASSGAAPGGAVRLSAMGLPQFYVLEAWPDRCAGVAHKRYALKCALAEARALGRALAVHKTTCISTDHTELDHELWTAAAAYFDFEELAASQPVPIVYIEDLVSAMTAYEAANRPQSPESSNSNDDNNSGNGGVGQFRVREFNLSVPTATLAADNTSDLLLRHLRYFENGFQVCDREENKHLWPISPNVPFNRHIVNIARKILDELGGNFTAVHIRRGDKVRKSAQWPHLDNDTRPESLREKLPRFAPVGSTLYLATNEEQPHFFDPLKDLYRILRLSDFERLWAPGSEWHREMQKLLGVDDPKFDLYMTGVVDDYIMGNSRKTVETFNDLTTDPRNGVGS